MNTARYMRAAACAAVLALGFAGSAAACDGDSGPAAADGLPQPDSAYNRGYGPGSGPDYGQTGRTVTHTGGYTIHRYGDGQGYPAGPARLEDNSMFPDQALQRDSSRDDSGGA